MHDAVASANHKSTHWVPRQTDARLKLVLGGIERRIWSIHAELLPAWHTTRRRIVNRTRLKEGISMMNLVERLIILPPQTRVQGQFWRQLDVVLDEEGIRPGARRDKNRLALELAGLRS